MCLPFPVPQLDSHVVRRAQHEGAIGMHLHKTKVVAVSLPLFDFLHGIEVIHTQMHVIGGGNKPLLANNELSTSHRDFTQFKTLQQGVGGIIPDEHIAVI